MKKIFNRRNQKKLQAKLRSDLSEPERMVWFRLKGKQLYGYKFRRQYGIGQYVVDFYCTQAKLVIEIDGESHFEEGVNQYERQRQDYIESQGIKVLRFTNNEVRKNIQGVIERLFFIL